MGFGCFGLGGKIGGDEYPPLVRRVGEDLNIRLFIGSRLHLRVIISARIRARDNGSAGPKRLWLLIASASRSDIFPSGRKNPQIIV